MVPMWDSVELQGCRVASVGGGGKDEKVVMLDWTSGNHVVNQTCVGVAVGVSVGVNDGAIVGFCRVVVG